MTDHPEFFRFLVNLARRFDEPAPPPSGPRPVRNGAGERPRAGGMATFYDHPTSRVGNQEA